MGKLNSIFLRNSKGRLAGTTIYSTGGVTIQREIQTQVRNPRTRSQMVNRVKLGNLVNMYAAMKPFFKKAFENKKPLVSDYNRFVSLNKTANNVYLTKEAVAQGVFNIDNYKISEGTLCRPLTYLMQEGIVQGPAIAGEITFDEKLTVAQLSAALIAGDSRIKPGMQLSVVYLADYENRGIPEVHLEEMIIDPDNTTEKAIQYIKSNVSAYNGFLTYEMGGSVAEGAAFVLSHTVGGKTYVSSETLVCSMLSDQPFYGDKALDAAIDSYGQSEEVFLDSNNAQKA